MKKNYMAPKVEVVIMENEDMLEASGLSLMSSSEKADQSLEVLGKQRMEEDEASWGNLW